MAKNPFSYLLKLTRRFLLFSPAEISPKEVELPERKKDRIEDQQSNEAQENDEDALDPLADEIEENRLISAYNDSSSSQLSPVNHLLKFFLLGLPRYDGFGCVSLVTVAFRVVISVVSAFPYQLIPLILANMGNVALCTSQMLIILAQ
jgi:hypothetical protein